MILEHSLILHNQFIFCFLLAIPASKKSKRKRRQGTNIAMDRLNPEGEQETEQEDAQDDATNNLGVEVRDEGEEEEEIPLVKKPRQSAPKTPPPTSTQQISMPTAPERPPKRPNVVSQTQVLLFIHSKIDCLTIILCDLT